MSDDKKIPVWRISLLLGCLAAALLFLLTTPPKQTGSVDSTSIPSAYISQRRQLDTYLATLSSDVDVRVEIIDAVLMQAAQHKLPPGFIVAIMAHENWTLTPHAVSKAGALGLMQVMPLHIPMPQCGISNREELFDIAHNICAGVYVWLSKLERCKGRTKCALLAYNGCIVTDEPFRSCYGYPQRVEDRMLDYLSES